MEVNIFEDINELKKFNHWISICSMFYILLD